MRRKIYDTLLAWKASSNGTSAIMLDGARRVGKSYIAEEFGRREYAACLVVDFAKVSSQVKSYFKDFLNDLDTFFLYLCAAYHTTLVPGNSLIIFDEVQRFPKAREAIKYLVADGRYHYLETGSLISIRKNVRNIVIPSEEHHVKMYPMDFEEFLWATGNEASCALMERAFRERLPLGEGTHRQLMGLFRQYMIVGGMPQVVQAFVDTHDLAKVDMIKRDILGLYESDIQKYSGTSRQRISGIFGEIPAQLSKHEKKFSPGDLRTGVRMRDLENAFDWLDNAMLVNLCYNATEPNVGLKMNMERSSLKCYLGDTGLLVSHAFDENELAMEDIHGRLLTGAIELNEGMLVENVVAQIIRAAGHRLYFYSNSSREKAEERMEVDFLLSQFKTARKKNVSPIEVKSGKTYSAVSLEKFRKKFGPYLDQAYVLHVKDLKVRDGITYLPLYLAPYLVRR